MTKWISPSTQVWLFSVTLSVLCLIIGYEAGGRLGLLIGFIFTALVHAFVFVFGEVRLHDHLKTQKLSGQDPWGLLSLVADLSYQLGLEPPTVYLANSQSAICLSMGQPWRRGQLVISTAVLEKLSTKELETVIAHQLGHLHHQDSFQFGVMAGLTRLFLGMARFLDRLLPINWSKKQKLPFFLHLMSPLAWLFLRIALSQNAYLRNDDLASHLTKDKQALAEALWKIEGLTRSRPLELPPCTSHFFIIDPQGSEKPSLWLSSHPPTSLRIKRLIGTATI